MPAITAPTTFDEAIKRLEHKTPLAIALSSAQWQAVPEEIREQALFTANVESARMLSELKGNLMAFLQQSRERTRGGKTALKVGSRADFVKNMQGWLIKNGFGDPLPAGVGRGERGVIPETTDIASNRRLKLIFDTQMRQAYAKSSLKYSTSDQVLGVYPAWRFVRDGFVEDPREDHVKHENEVRLKSDTKYWVSRNDPKFGGFGVPWGPWGFNSQMGVEEVGRREAIQLGLIKPNEKPKGQNVRFKKGVRASIKRMAPELVERVSESLGDLVEIDGDEIKLVE